MPSDLLAAFPFLRQADRQVHSLLKTYGRPVSVPDGGFICTEGTECGHMSLVLDGTARVFKTGETGREITLYRLGRGDACILTASCIMNGVAFPAHAVADGPVEAFAIPAGTFRDWVERFPAWRGFVFGLFAERLATVIAVIDEVAFRRMDARLAGYLLETAAAAPDQRIETTHETVAAELGSSREVISRLLKDLEHDRLVALARGVITVLDAQGLAAIARRSSVT